MTDYIKKHKQAANAVDPYTGSDLPKYEKGKHCPVTLPSRGPEGGWKAATEKEWDEVFRFDRKTGECGLRKEHWRDLAALHMRAYYASGSMLCDCTNVEDTIAMFRRNGLACAPWLKSRHFWGLKNSVKAAAARRAQGLQGVVRERHETSLERLFEMLDEAPDADLSHSAAYNLEAIKVALSEAVGRDDFEMPTTLKDLRLLLPKLLDRVGVCPDCLIEKLLILVEHAKGGEHAGQARSRDCKVCNAGGRGATDVVVDAAHQLGKTLTAVDHARLTKLAVAHARPGQATREAKRRYARAQRLAAAATVEADEEALGHVSTTRGRAADDTYQARRAAALEEEAARAAEKKEYDADRARNRVSFCARMRVVVKETGARGVVERTAGSGAWVYVELDDETGAKSFRPSHLEIDNSRKARKPAARKPAARKPAAKPSTKKPAKKKAKTRKGQK